MGKTFKDQQKYSEKTIRIAEMRKNRKAGKKAQEFKKMREVSGVMELSFS